MEQLFIPLILTFAFFVESVFGFGGGLVAIPLLSLFINPADAVMLMLLFQTLKGYLIFGSWRHLKWEHFSWLPIGVMIGVIIGVQIMDAIAPNTLRILMAIYIITFLIQDIWKPFSMPLKTIKQRSFAAGLSGGLVHGMIGTGGPPMVTYFKSLTLGKEVFRAHVILALFIGNLPRFVLEAQDIWYSEVIRQHFITSMAVFCFAMYFGPKIPKLLSEEKFMAGIRIVLFVSAISLFTKAIL